MDIPTGDGTPLYAIDDGKVKIAGYHINYSDGTISVSEKKLYIMFNDNKRMYCFATLVYNSLNTLTGMKIVTSSSILTTDT